MKITTPALACFPITAAFTSKSPVSTLTSIYATEAAAPTFPPPEKPILTLLFQLP